MQNKDIQFNANSEQVAVIEDHRNTDQSLIHITEDKLRLILTQHHVGIPDKNQWQTPLSILIAIIITFCTTDFKNAFGLEKQVWKALFLVSLISTFAWTIYAAWKAWKAPKLEDVITRIKNK